MRRFFLGALTAILVFVFGGILYLRFGWAEVRGDISPSRLESSLMQMAVHALRAATRARDGKPGRTDERDPDRGRKDLSQRMRGMSWHPGAGT